MEKVEAGRPDRRLLRKAMVIVVAKVVKNARILDVFWNTGTGFGDGCRMLREVLIIMPR